MALGQQLRRLMPLSKLFVLTRLSLLAGIQDTMLLVVLVVHAQSRVLEHADPMADRICSSGMLELLLREMAICHDETSKHSLGQLLDWMIRRSAGFA